MRYCLRYNTIPQIQKACDFSTFVGREITCFILFYFFRYLSGNFQSGRNSILLPYKNQPVVMLVVNFIPMLLGYLLKVIMFRHRGFGNDYAKGYAEAKIALPKIKKPKFYWRNLPNYLWCEGSMIVGLFRYLVYRIQRALKIT